MTTTPSYKGHRYPVEIINHCVWLYFRFPLSLREVEELMLARGVAVSYETIRRWCAKFGQAYANQLRRRRPRPGDKWHLDEMFVRINGRLRYLWRAVDQHGNVLIDHADFTYRPICRGPVVGPSHCVGGHAMSAVKVSGSLAGAGRSSSADQLSSIATCSMA